MNNMDYATLEERILAHIAENSGDSDFMRELLSYCCADAQVTRERTEVSTRTFGKLFGTTPSLIIIDDYIDVNSAEQPKKKPVPFYQTLNKQPKFVRK